MKFNSLFLGTIGFLTTGLMASGCSSTTPQYRDDPLIGQIIEVDSHKSIDFDALVDRAVQTNVIYLGEKHDNAEHHAWQYDLLQAFASRGIKPAIGFEFFQVGQTADLMQYVDAKPSSLKLAAPSKKTNPESQLRRQLGWSDRTDQDWQFYFKLIDHARIQGLEIFGADISQSLSRRISRSGIDALTGIELGLVESPLVEDKKYRRYMYETFRNSHCGWGEEPYLARLYEAWNIRNQRMARSIQQMLQAHPERPVMLIVGNGHTEHNRGIVERVAALEPDITQLNIGMWEIAIEPQPLQAYLDSDAEMGDLHDLIWFAQRRDYTNPCEAFNRP